MSRLSERIENFHKAFDILSLSVKCYRDDKENILMHMSLVQSFEVCYELAWKVLKDYLQQKGIVTKTPKDAIKNAFLADIIRNGQVWIDMQKDRNTTVHEYNLDKVSIILEHIDKEYADELLRFSKWAEDILDE